MSKRVGDIVQKLWGLCNILRDDGITYHQYVTELTYLLFLKMARETGAEEQLPAGYRWGDLAARDGAGLLRFYRRLLAALGAHGARRVAAIYAGARTSLKAPLRLKRLVAAIDALDWFSARGAGLGELYEGLLEKNATEVKGGAGQYFTPRPLVDSIVSLVKPEAGELVQDPAAGTGGFLVAAGAYQGAASPGPFYGVELVADTHRLLLMNLLLHGIEAEIRLGDTLSALGAGLPRADVILTNPPFGARGGGPPARADFAYPTSNKQLAFLQHVYRGLKPGGRAAVVVPDNVLFEEGAGAQIRSELMALCDLHTILRLPTGIFYAQGVKTNVLFFTRGEADAGSTRAVWIYDMRTDAPSFGKRNPLTRGHFEGFEAAFGADPRGESPRRDQGERGRLRRFSREALRARGDNLDILWLKEGGADELPAPEVVAAEVMAHLEAAMAEVSSLASLLEGEAV